MYYLMPEKNQTTALPAHNQVLMEWQTPEFMPHAKGARWLLAAGTLVLVLTAYAILTGSATMAIVFLLLGGMFYLTHNQSPRIINVRVKVLGIEIDGQFHPYHSIKAFWIVYDPPFIAKLYLKPAGKSQEIRIELMNQDPVGLRRLLAREIPEIEGGDERWSDFFIRLLRLQ
ncbi:MAG: hypothetical protein ABIG11_00795 [bacterium]